MVQLSDLYSVKARMAVLNPSFAVGKTLSTRMR